MPAIRLPATATITCIQEWHLRLLSAITDGDGLVLDGSGVEAVDTAFLQLLIAARRDAACRGVGFRLAPRPSRILAEAFERMGLRPDEALADVPFLACN